MHVRRYNFLWAKGRIYRTAEVDFDFSFGPEVGFGINSTERGQVTAQDGIAYETKMKRSDPEMDVRARVGMAVYYRHLGLSASFAHGVTNYLRGYDGANPQAYPVVLRLGILYRL